MKTFTIKALAAAVGIGAALALTGCGGSGDGYESKNDHFDKTSIRQEVNGVAVDGLVPNATVKMYKLDFTAADWKGELLDEGTTDSNGRFNDIYLELGDFEEKAYLFEVSDYAADEPIEYMLSMVAKKSLIDSQAAVYVTPMSTMLVEFVKAKYADADPASVESAMLADSAMIFKAEQTTLKDRFGLGVLTGSTDLFISPVVFDQSFTADTTDENNTSALNRAKSTIALRTANSVFLDSLLTIKNEFNLSAGLYEILVDVAKDQVDGLPDLYKNGVALDGALADLNPNDTSVDGQLPTYVSALYKSKTQAEQTAIPGENGVTVATLPQLMVDEINANNIDDIEVALISSASEQSTFKGQAPGDFTGKCVKQTTALKITVDGAEVSVCPNALPVIDAPSFLLGEVNSALTIDLSSSYDEDIEAITIENWRVITGPAGAVSSFANYSGTQLAKDSIAKFTTDTAGTYEILVDATDDKETVSSAPISVQILAADATNNAPTIDSVTSIADMENLSASEQALSASFSDPDGDDVVPTWTCEFERFSYLDPEPVPVRQANSASAAVLIQPFEGTYNCTITVTDGLLTSAPAEVSFKVEKPGPNAAVIFGASLGLLGLIFARRKKQ